jgi:2-keto-4-pentenoate hydratase
MNETSRDAAAAADLLEAARDPRRRLGALPPGLAPASWDEAYAIQDAIVRRAGGPAGWKVGAVTPEAEPFRSALTADTVFEGPARLPLSLFNVVGLEAELTYRLGNDLPPRSRPYSRAEVTAAIASVHAAIEIVDTRYVAWGQVDRLSQVADRMNHGVLVVGTGRADWDAIDPLAQPVRLRIDGKVAVEGIGGNSAGEPIRMLEWLANGGAHSLGGLRAGDRVTTGSCTGTVFAPGAARVVAEFPGLGRAELDLVSGGGAGPG